MKRMIWIAGLLLCTAAWADAQNTGGGSRSSRNKTSVSASGSNRGSQPRKVAKMTKAKPGKKRVVTQPVPLEQDKVYPWKNGQASTPAGHEATGVNGEGFVSPRKDSLRRPRQ